MSGSGLTRDEKESTGVWNKVRYYEYCRPREKIRRNEKAVSFIG